MLVTLYFEDQGAYITDAYEGNVSIGKLTCAWGEWKYAHTPFKFPGRNHLSLMVFGLTHCSQLFQNISSGSVGGSLRTTALIRCALAAVWDLDLRPPFLSADAMRTSPSYIMTIWTGIRWMGVDGQFQVARAYLNSADPIDETGLTVERLECTRHEPLKTMPICCKPTYNSQSQPKSFQTRTNWSFSWSNNSLWQQCSRTG